jgi:hypothetical protein
MLDRIAWAHSGMKIDQGRRRVKGIIFSCIMVIRSSSSISSSIYISSIWALSFLFLSTFQQLQTQVSPLTLMPQSRQLRTSKNTDLLFLSAPRQQRPDTCLNLLSPCHPQNVPRKPHTLKTATLSPQAPPPPHPAKHFPRICCPKLAEKRLQRYHLPRALTQSIPLTRCKARQNLCSSLILTMRRYIDPCRRVPLCRSNRNDGVRKSRWLVGIRQVALLGHRNPAILHLTSIGDLKWWVCCCLRRVWGTRPDSLM